MRLTKFFSLGAAVATATTILAFSVGAQAEDHWDRYHHDYDHHEYDRYHHEHYAAERPVYVAPRPPVYVAPPVIMAPPMMMAPSGPPSLNLNFNMPL